MHAVMFGCKRAYYATLGLSRKELANMGLTAARFDLLYALSGGSKWPQSALRGVLGVCASVVSRMLKSLEELGYVCRGRLVDDLRQRWVSLTDAGRARIHRAIEHFITSGYAQLALIVALVPGSAGRWWDESDGFFALDNAESVLRHLRRAFGDTAFLSYPWHPDD
jgi:DNA-binding MarR family transcriptional regulator